jgi:LPXTG-site transpeptidase (sortase) family protein
MRIKRTHKNLRKVRELPLAMRMVISVACILSGQVILQEMAQSNPLPFTDAAALPGHQKPPSGLPATITIQSIGVSAHVAYTGLKADGTMDIKKNPDETAWYQFGARPGDEGSAVIAGHSGWTGLHGSIFNNIYKLQKGDKISVLDQKGHSNVFVVTGSKQYSPTANASAVFQSSDGKSHLNLVTCDGVWVNATNSDSSRLVVFSDLEQ